MKTTESVRQWLVSYLAEIFTIQPTEVDTSVTFTEWGLESGIAMGLVGELEQWIGFELPLDILMQYPTIDSLSEYVSTATRL